jgi:hypothetical protein
MYNACTFQFFSLRVQAQIVSCGLAIERQILLNSGQPLPVLQRGFGFRRLSSECCQLATNSPRFCQLRLGDRHRTATFSRQLLQKWQKQPIAPVAYYVFDLLWHNESDWTAQPLINRREQLNKILKSDGRISDGGYVEEHGIELFRLAKESAQRDWSRRFGNGTLRSGVLLHHPRLLSGFPFAGSPCSG